jgi:sulfur-carrier protein
MPAMRVVVKLFASFQRGRFVAEAREYTSSTKVENIVADLHNPPVEIGVILVNGRHVDLHYGPSDGDVLAIFPVIGGG